VAAFSGELPKLSNGKCDESQNAQPSAKTAVGTFTATAKLIATARSGSGGPPAPDQATPAAHYRRPGDRMSGGALRLTGCVRILGLPSCWRIV
jgi:hypothetical protein